VIATSWCAWLQPEVMCGCKKTWLCLCSWKTTWLFGIWLQAWVVCDCKNCWFISVLQKIKKELNQCVIATIWRAWLQPGVMCGCKTWLCLCGWKATWLFGIWLQAWVVCDCKNCWFISVTAKKKKKGTEPVCDCNYLACVLATMSYVRLQKNLTLSVWLKSYLVI
jgi:hypothetical protein